MSLEMQGIVQRLDRLEQDHRDSRDILVEIRTTLKHLIEKTDTQNDRINKREAEVEDLESDVEAIQRTLAQQEGRDNERKDVDDRRFKKWGVMIIAAEIVVAVIVAIGVKVFWK